MLEGVLGAGGTAHEAAIPGYTWRARPARRTRSTRDGRYSDTAYVASFVGFAPAHDPKLLVAVMVDEPQGAIYGGGSRRRRSSRSRSFALPYLGIPPQLASPAQCGLRELFPHAQGVPPVVLGLAYDGRGVAPGTLFFCVRGFTATGTTSRPPRRRGAVALVVDHPLGLGVPEIRVADVRAAMAPVAARFQAIPRRLASSASPARAARRPPPSSYASCSRPPAAAGAARHREARRGPRGRARAHDARGRRPAAAFAAMAAGGNLACAVEVSSHALDQRRADKIR